MMDCFHQPPLRCSHLYLPQRVCRLDQQRDTVLSASTGLKGWIHHPATLAVDAKNIKGTVHPQIVRICSFHTCFAFCSPRLLLCARRPPLQTWHSPLFLSLGVYLLDSFPRLLPFSCLCPLPRGMRVEEEPRGERSQGNRLWGERPRRTHLCILACSSTNKASSVLKEHFEEMRHPYTIACRRSISGSRSGPEEWEDEEAPNKEMRRAVRSWEQSHADSGGEWKSTRNRRPKADLYRQPSSGESD